MKEIWKSIENYEGLYEVSNLGRVKALPKYKKSGYGKINLYKERMLKLRLDKDGYLKCVLTKDHKHTNFFVHRLVASAFIPNDDNCNQVNHKDEVKSNNIVSNLEWCNNAYNVNYGSRNQRVSEVQINDKAKSKPVRQYDLHMNFVAEYPSLKEAGRCTGFDSSNIGSCCNGKLKTAYGFKWLFV